MKYKTITIDLAKNVFQVCGVNEYIKPQFNQKLKRNQLFDFMRQQSPTMVVMEACYSSHYRESNRTAMIIYRKIRANVHLKKRMQRKNY
jgi:transposase